jgi:hypothetical protein
MQRESKPLSGGFPEGLLRSINIVFDADFPERIGHFRPTSKSAKVLEALLGELPQRAFLIIAPYGSGKSLVAAYALHVSENTIGAGAALSQVTDRLKDISPPLASVVRSRTRKPSARGLVLALHGAQSDLADALAEAANASFRRARKGQGAGRPRSITAAEDALKTLKAVLEAAEAGDFDSVLIVWDEFGRHLEDLLARGRAAELGQLQSMAELASRARSPRLTLALLAHRALSQYSLTAPQTIRVEWAKVEGRFELLQYIDDSKEMYRLIASIVADRRTSPPDGAHKKWLRSLIRSIRSQGIFKDLSVESLSNLLESAYPLHPLALYVLPRLAARISQNERTIFSCIVELDLSHTVGLAQIYDYFADAMRADTSAGGSHRQYLETETAIRRAGSIEAVTALKAACLLGLGLVGERGHVSRELLSIALSRPDSVIKPEQVIQQLIDEKLLLYRKHSGDVSVWHGADLDLRGALEAAKERQRAGFNLIGFVSREVPPPVWRPVEFNDTFHIKRYFSGRYLTPSQFLALCEPANTLVETSDGADGLLLFVLAESAADQALVRERAGQVRLGARVVVAVPAREAALAEASLEVACLEQMLRDPELIGKDPLIEVEMRHLLDDARGYLHRAVDQLVTPHPEGPSFYHSGQQLSASSLADIRTHLSHIAKELYRLTPKINNELINRRRVSAPVANARKKLEMAILERSGMPGLGIEGNFPDASIFRTVLLSTGLYREDSSGSWRFAEPKELSDEGLRAVWERVQTFFQAPQTDGPKNFAALRTELLSPPIGLREGLLPVLLAAAFRAFPIAVSLYRDGIYVADILPSVIEDIARRPDLYRLEVLQPTPDQQGIIAAVQEVFSDCDPAITRQRDLIRTGFDSLRGWLVGLPPIARATNELSEAARDFRTAVADHSDPVHFLCKTLPELMSTWPHPTATQGLRELRSEIEGVLNRQRRRAAHSVRRSLDVDLDRGQLSLLAVCQRWTKCFSVPDLQLASGAQTVSFINRLQQSYESDELLLDSLGSHLLGQPISRWSDASMGQFERALADAVRQVEDEAVRVAIKGASNQVIIRNLSRLIKARLRDLYENLHGLSGEEAAREFLLQLTKAELKKVSDGNHSRSAR